MASAANSVKKAKHFPDGTYEIEWAGKPLGFSIVMDTTGKNAYVSSIQKEMNVQRGLKLAAQIIKVGDKNAQGVKHNDILDMIRRAKAPISLTFQPRSFANNPESSKHTP